MNGLTIKPLEVADLEAVARVHCAAFPGSALTALGSGAVKRYYLWQLLGPHDVVAIGAVSNGNLEGFCFAGTFNASLAGYLDKNRNFLFWRLALRPWLLTNTLIRERIRMGVQRLLRFRRKKAAAKVGQTAPKQFGVLSIAVNPAAQGSGAGKAMMLWCEEAARTRGAGEMRLSVLPDNLRAIRFYERGGWEKSPANGLWRGTMLKRLQ
jgi:ribosomal protein S18 acetylase RimI-like enzyme